MHANVPAQGRPPGCPEGVTDPHGDGTPSPVSLKCSYDDAIGKGVTRLGGKVLAEDGIVGRGIADVLVTVHRVEGQRAPGTGTRVASTSTDAQGGFHLTAVLPPASYDIVARAADGTPLAHVRLELEGERPRAIEDVRLFVPIDPGLK